MASVADVTIFFTVSTTYLQTGFTLSSSNSSDSPTGLARKGLVSYQEAFRDKTSAIFTIRHAIARRDGEVGEYSRPQAGTVVTDATMLSTSLLVSKIPIQGHQGRMYLPLLNEFSTTAQGRVSSTNLDALQDAADLFLDRLDFRNTDMVLRRPDNTLDLVTKLVVKPYVGRQDRRLVRSRR